MARKKSTKNDKVDDNLSKFDEHNYDILIIFL